MLCAKLLEQGILPKPTVSYTIISINPENLYFQDRKGIQISLLHVNGDSVKSLIGQECPIIALI